MKDKLAEYVESGGWSSKLFAANAIPLINELKKAGLRITVGRSVIHLGGKLKAYVHHNGRTPEFATITDWDGNELQSFHHTKFNELRAFVLQSLGV